ncbi:SpoIID/LytB domain-containing protein [Alicyclobacillus suci]|uniref:SpoIID/LytB domain-containing protein n=1 Tax=Alicyclobacillus suci TaxID=2816080 RepID=UPI001F249ACE|nr:SpoIID/LytB domain-containing protein [Alicyclobacillus suci]
MRQRRFVAVGSKAYQKQRQAPAGPGQQTGDSGPAVTPGEVIRFVVCVALIFFGMIGVPTIVAKLVHRGAMPDVTAWLHTADAKRTVRVYHTSSDTTTSMALNDYVLDVLAAEFSPGAPMASLKAAAVATRTYAIHAMTSGAPGGVAAKHDANVTDDSGLDLPLSSQSDIEAEYPSQSLQFLSQLQAAVEETDGLIVTYQQQPILAFMFDESPGETRTSQAALHQKIPYLTAIACPDDKVDPDATTTHTFTARELGQAFGLNQVDVAKLKPTRASDGFVTAVSSGTKTISGADFSAALNLPSADFTWKSSGGNLTITTHGRGLDLGMSLHEAQALAARGMGWQTIISHFYPGTSIQSDTKVP